MIMPQFNFIHFMIIGLVYNGEKLQAETTVLVVSCKLRNCLLSSWVEFGFVQASRLLVVQFWRFIGSCRLRNYVLYSYGEL